MDVLVTGAAGQIGRHLVEHFADAGYSVTATDCVLHAGLPVELDITDLTDRLAVYRLMAKGYDAVVHAGNHPNSGAVRPAERLLTENTAMNANVFWSALTAGVERLVFISSIQAMLNHNDMHWWRRRHEGSGDDLRPTFPELPLHGRMPPMLGSNAYGLSKVFGEQTLAGLAKANPQLRTASLRPARVITQRSRAFWMGRDVSRYSLFAEASVYVEMEDVVRACRRLVDHVEPGHETFLLARSPRFQGMSYDEVCREFFPDVPVTRPMDGIGGMVDLRHEQEKLGWVPEGDPVELALGDRVFGDRLQKNR